MSIDGKEKFNQQINRNVFTETEKQTKKKEKEFQPKLLLLHLRWWYIITETRFFFWDWWVKRVCKCASAHKSLFPNIIYIELIKWAIYVINRCGEVNEQAITQHMHYILMFACSLVAVDCCFFFFLPLSFSRSCLVYLLFNMNRLNWKTSVTFFFFAIHMGRLKGVRIGEKKQRQTRQTAWKNAHSQLRHKGDTQIETKAFTKWSDNFRI